jgi:membrane-associated protein
MEFLGQIVDIFVHLDKHLSQIIQDYGLWTYLILFLVIFCETGLVVTPFLPGDSLLFAVGAFAATEVLSVYWLLIILGIAATLGNMVNYQVGYAIGPKIFQREKIRFLNREYLERTHQFYEKHGGKTVIIARFLPIIRTFAPFVAGIGRMNYAYFTLYNLVGCVAWVAGFILAGYYFGNIPTVKRNFSIIIFAIIIISVLPAVIKFLQVYLKRPKK